MGRLPAIFVAAVAISGLAFLTFVLNPHSARFALGCGVERWNVKTLQDRPILRPARTVTVRYLVTRSAPSQLPNTRLAFEHDVFTVTAAVTLVRLEDEGGYPQRPPGPEGRVAHMVRVVLPRLRANNRIQSGCV